MPDIYMIIANLGKAKHFTTLDLKSGYHQIVLAEKDRAKTLFFCKNAASIFQRATDDVLREYIGKCYYVYVDDVIVLLRNRK